MFWRFVDLQEQLRSKVDSAQIAFLRSSVLLHYSSSHMSIQIYQHLNRFIINITVYLPSADWWQDARTHHQQRSAELWTSSCTHFLDAAEHEVACKSKQIDVIERAIHLFRSTYLGPFASQDMWKQRRNGDIHFTSNIHTYAYTFYLVDKQLTYRWSNFPNAAILSKFTLAIFSVVKLK